MRRNQCIMLGLGPQAGARHCIRSTLSIGCCNFLRERKLGTLWICQVWNKILDGQDNRLLRLPECLAACRALVRAESKEYAQGRDDSSVGVTE